MGHSCTLAHKWNAAATGRRRLQPLVMRVANGFRRLRANRFVDRPQEATTHDRENEIHGPHGDKGRHDQAVAERLASYESDIFHPEYWQANGDDDWPAATPDPKANCGAQQREHQTLRRHGVLLLNFHGVRCRTLECTLLHRLIAVGRRPPSFIRSATCTASELSDSQFPIALVRAFAQG